MIGRDDLESMVRRAGALALDLFRRGVSVESKADRSYVTEADREVERMLRAEVRRITRDATIVGEEGPCDRGERGAPLVVIDPIDGTGSFVAGLPTWAISVGIVEEDAPGGAGARPVAGVVYLPVVGELYIAHGGTAEEDGPRGRRPLERLPASPPPLGSEDFILIHSTAHRRYDIAFPGKTRNLGSVAYHLALVARGASPCALLGRSALHDVAGGMALLLAVGGEARYLDGRPVPFGEFVRHGKPEAAFCAVAPGRADVLGTICRRRTPPGEGE